MVLGLEESRLGEILEADLDRFSPEILSLGGAGLILILDIELFRLIVESSLRASLSCWSKLN